MVRGTPKTFYIFSGDTLIGEVYNGSPSYAYTWGPDGLVSQRKLATNTSLWYHYGPQGETRQLTDSAGAVVDTYLYDAYGKQLSSTGTDVNPFRYGGKVGYYTDLNSAGFILAGQRWYSPHLMRWLSRDPIEYEGGDNVYAYVGGRPVRFLDPEGLDWLDNLSNGASGFGDSISFGVTGHLRDVLGQALFDEDPPVDQESTAYRVGDAAGVAWSCATAAAGAAKAAGYQTILRRYPNTGGAGITVKKNAKRIFAVDIHKWGKNSRWYKYPHVHKPPAWKHWPWK